ncbi:hypothetical protein B0J12DRAFT_704697 [Macrophomina phaseolina]|uniref:Rhodopsin domain-containing protein n=1 Tax=Macrophomina phaseolina TaxID=35725 RepID=A0ABQ8FUK6_9PEZI|nr:hypothetical protein B0J12DRAFT_704697 [Macrophomina phaseolina]
MANAVPPGPDDSIALQTLVPCGILQAIAVTLFVARMYTRLRPVRNLWWDDYIISVAIATSVPAYSLQITACKHGLGRHTYYVSSEDLSTTMHHLFGLYCLNLVGVGLVRISVACSLLRFLPSKDWQRTLFVLIAIQVLSIIVAMIMQFIECRPVRAMWEVVPDNECWTPAQMQAWGYAYSAFMLTQDIILSLIPITFIRKLRRPLPERIVIACVMALGLVASAAVVIKIVYMRHFDITGDALRILVQVIKWGKIEELLGISAACIPPLKSLVERLLKRLGLPGFGSYTVSSLDCHICSQYGSDGFHELNHVECSPRPVP